MNKIVKATLFSLPLLPFLILPQGTLREFVDADDLLWATPLIVEFMVFYGLYAFTKHRQSLSRHEQKLLLVLAIGIFVIMGIPLTLVQISALDATALSLIFMMTYALIRLVTDTIEVSATINRIKSYFKTKYIWPALAAFLLMLITVALVQIELNAVVCYFILKNYSFAVTNKLPERLAR